MSVGKLTDAKCKNAKFSLDGTANKLADGGGLVLHLTKTSKLWKLRYRFLGKEKTLSFGPYPEVGLREARERRDDAKALLRDNVDPMAHKKQKRQKLIDEHQNQFEQVAREWHAHKKHTWKGVHADRIMGRLERYIFPAVGRVPIRQLNAPELLEAIRPIERAGKYETAHRMFQTSSQIFRYAVACGKANRDITADLKGALAPVQHKTYAHLSEKELPAFLSALDRYDGEYAGYTITKLAFQLLVLTFVRSAEIRGAKWEEIDWSKKQWRIPAERMKMKEQHIVPLAKQSIDLLKRIHDITGDSYGGVLFPSLQSPRKVMSENTFLRVIERLGYKGRTTGHGFRSTASTILNENGFRGDVIERQLAHGERDQIRAAYNHAEYLKERADMMQWWADYLDKAHAKG